MSELIDPARSRSQRQISAYTYLFDKITRERISLAHIPDTSFYIDRALTHSTGPGWEGYAAELKHLINNDDITGLKQRLLPATDEGDRYRSISPLLMLLLTPEEGQALKPPYRLVTPEMLNVG
ncbi:hypothetical protein H0194_08935 [Corynebacterium incognita]|uniref:Uncharacterized protein n=1 Tax=Corynebacterium incognita TaxID=2754725 RepID=A0A7G7CNK6_9CORY|nr:hypothetical protein [Corynebacterium incognita]QNE89172.1 hypothetical protein H0194_08935 [Corynebacterium incognita]